MEGRTPAVAGALEQRARSARWPRGDEVASRPRAGQTVLAQRGKEWHRAKRRERTAATCLEFGEPTLAMPNAPLTMPTQQLVEARNEGAAIAARDLTRHFGSHVAVDRLSLDIERGETFGLLGANGAGKTTFIRMVTGYLIPTAGSLLVDGVSPSLDPRSVQRRLGFVAETARIYPDLRVEGFLRFMGGVRGMSGAKLKDAVERALAQFHLEDVAKRLIGNLSKGFQQRVSLAQGFLHDPALLIVDEPTSGLDPLQQAEVRETLAAMRGQRTVILCTHDLAEARQLSTRVAVLNQGRLVATGSTDEVLGGDDPLALFRGGAPQAAAS
jgi:ABC-2 type transport system ATP-binding protein